MLVFEDLHWADPALLAFLEHLADWAEGVPLLVLCTARPELYERHPGWATGLRNAHTINLPPLSEAETALLIGSLLERSLLPSETQQRLLERAGGNPLYAEEFVRMLAERGPLEPDAPLPETVQALIAARLDTLPSERKSLDGSCSRATADVFRHSLAEAAARHLPAWAGRLTPHVLRHFCASQLYLGGMDLAAIQQALGHAWVATTMNYINVHATHVEDAWVTGQRRVADRWKGLAQ